jgi:cyanamide hydratase
MITAVAQLLQLTTLLGGPPLIRALTATDNVGLRPELVHPDTVKEISGKFPRNKWTGCFANVVRDEIKLKPWSHTTSMGQSEDAIVSGILANPVMAKYD